MVRRSTRCRLLNPFKAHLSQIKRIDKHVDHANGVALVKEIIEAWCCNVGVIFGRTYVDIVQDLFAVLAAAGLQFPYLAIVLIGTGVVLVCIGAIFWRRASRSRAIGQPPEDAASDAPEGSP
jgi:hypothetical protein